MIRHHTPAQQANTTECRCTMQQFDKPTLLLVIEEERLMRHPRDKVVATIWDHHSLFTRHMSLSIPNPATLRNILCTPSYALGSDPD